MHGSRNVKIGNAVPLNPKYSLRWSASATLLLQLTRHTQERKLFQQQACACYSLFFYRVNSPVELLDQQRNMAWLGVYVHLSLDAKRWHISQRQGHVPHDSHNILVPTFFFHTHTPRFKQFEVLNLGGGGRDLDNTREMRVVFFPCADESAMRPNR